ncbi:hypothetical protein DRQ18_07160 [bacterium]|nr:MAG: hypothetical protein DRQ18_07160 [bacterium]
MKALLFSLGEELLGIPIEEVRVLVRIKELEHLPRQPKWIKGIIKHREKVYPVVSLSSILVLEEPEKLIGLVPYRDLPFILGIGNILGIFDIELRAERMDLLPSEYMLGIGEHEGKLVLILNIEKLLEKRRLKRLEKISKRK